MIITWIEEIRLLSDLIPCDKNPRYITDKEYKRLIKSIKERGYGNRIKINRDNTITSGHQRLQALKELGYISVPVLIPNRLLTKEEFEKELIEDNTFYGNFDMDVLANHYEIDMLLDCGISPELLIGPIDAVEILADGLEKEKEKMPCKDCPYNKEKDA